MLCILLVCASPDLKRVDTSVGVSLWLVRPFLFWKAVMMSLFCLKKSLSPILTTALTVCCCHSVQSWHCFDLPCWQLRVSQVPFSSLVAAAVHRLTEWNIHIHVYTDFTYSFSFISIAQSLTVWKEASMSILTFKQIVLSKWFYRIVCDYAVFLFTTDSEISPKCCCT